MEVFSGSIELEGAATERDTVLHLLGCRARGRARELDPRAFLTFTQAAGSLEKSYTQLQSEVARLHGELKSANSELERRLEENARMRGYLTRVRENLPCGVLV